MKKWISIVCIVISFFLNAQEKYRNYAPFQHEEKWGLIDTNQNIIVEPEHSYFVSFQDFRYVQFQDLNTYDLITGEVFNWGKYSGTVTIEGDEYTLFKKNQKSVLVNFQNNDTITLKLVYDYMYNKTMLNSETNEKYEYIFGDLSNSDEVIILKNNKKLPAATKKRLNKDEFEFIGLNNDKIGLISVYGDEIHLLNSKFELLKQISTEKDRFYEQMNEVSDYAIQNLFNEKKAYKTDDMYPAPTEVPSWEMEERILNFSNDFYLENENDKHNIGEWYYLRNENLKLRAWLRYFGSVKGVEFKSSAIIVDDRYIKPGTLMFPEKYLRKLESE